MPLVNQSFSFVQTVFLFQLLLDKSKNCYLCIKTLPFTLACYLFCLKKLFETQWGKLMESLLEGDLLKIINEREGKVKSTYRNVKSGLQTPIDF